MPGADVVCVLHEICPLVVGLECLHFSAKVWREDLEDPSIRILICEGPGKVSVSDVAHISATSNCLPVEIEHNQLPFCCRFHYTICVCECQ